MSSALRPPPGRTRTACSRAARRSPSAMAIRAPVAATMAARWSRAGCAGPNCARSRSASACSRARRVDVSPAPTSNAADQAAAMPRSMVEPSASTAALAAADSSRACARSPCRAAISASRSLTWDTSSRRPELSEQAARPRCTRRPRRPGRRRASRTLPMIRSAVDSPHRSPSARNRSAASAAAGRIASRSPSFSARPAVIIQAGRGEPRVPARARLVEVAAHPLLVLDEHRVHRPQQPGDRVLVDVEGVEPLDQARVGRPPSRAAASARAHPPPAGAPVTSHARSVDARAAPRPWSAGPVSASPGTARASPTHSAMSESLPSSSAMMLSDTARLSASPASSRVAPVAQRGEDVVAGRPAAPRASAAGRG